MCTTNSIVDFSGKMLSDEDIKHRTRDLLKLVLGKEFYRFYVMQDNSFLEHDKIKTFRKDEPFLLRFLHCSDFDVLLALKKVRQLHNSNIV